MTTQAENDDNANDNDEEDDEEDPEERGMRCEWKGTTTTDQSGEEEYKDTESQKIQIRQDDEPVGVTKDDQPMAHPDEDEGEDDNPVLKTAGQSQMANPTKEENIAAQDIVPVQARAYSLPVDTGIYQAALRFDRLRNPDRTKEALEYIAKWNEGKKPPEQPIRKVTLKRANVNGSVIAPGISALIPTIKPTVNPRDDNSVPTKSLVNPAPTIAASVTVSTLSERAQEILEKVRKEPFGVYNLAGRAWRKMLPELLDVR